MMIRRVLPLVLPAILLSACGGGEGGGNANLDTLDAELTSANAADPAVTSALQDQIMVDPALAQQANADAVRPPARPYSGAVPTPGVAAGSAAKDEPLVSAPPPGDCPGCRAGREALTLGELAGASGGRDRGCSAKLRYAAGWANRLPAGVPLHPDARVNEAAGTDADGCRMRVVSFTVAQPLARMVDWYYTRATKASFTAEHQADGDEHVLGGTRGDGGAFVAYLSPDGARTAVDLVVDGG